MKKIPQFGFKKVSGVKKINLYDHSKMYKTKEWQYYSRRFLKVNPRCYICGAKATVTDHIMTHRGNLKLFEKLDNHMPECASHHSIVTNLFDRHLEWTPEECVKNKIEWIVAHRTVNIAIKVLPTYRQGKQNGFEQDFGSGPSEVGYEDAVIEDGGGVVRIDSSSLREGIVWEKQH